MLAGPDAPVVQHTGCHCTPGNLVHTLPRHQGQADRPLVPSGVLPSLFLERCHIGQPPVTQELSSSPGLLINDGEWSFVGCFTSFQQKDGICLDLCVSGQHSSSLTTSSCRMGTLLCSLFLSSASGGWICRGELGFWLKAEVKKALSTSAFSSSREGMFPPQYAIKDGESPWPLFVINAYGKAFFS